MYSSNRPLTELKLNAELQSLKNQHSYKQLITAACRKTIGKYAIHDAIVGDTCKTCVLRLNMFMKGLVKDEQYLS
jgi:7-cyano-7-deazaguanine synthase in queuosine biosynthesis